MCSGKIYSTLYSFNEYTYMIYLPHGPFLCSADFLACYLNYIIGFSGCVLLKIHLYILHSLFLIHHYNNIEIFLVFARYKN